jgi:hypothetical protein
MDQALKKEEIPAGGIADFVMTDEQIEQLEAEELKEQFGTNGIAQFSDVGKKMANFGRYGDDTVAHVETGELIVPRALIEKNPELKESIFKHLKELGVEDPERYVVGESKNSVNPTTGLPEFFFKKIFKSVSKIAKGVGKALKKAAPLIIPMAINYFAPGLGTVMSGALGAGIGTLVQGGSVKDAFKSAVLGGATGAVTAGFSGKGNFMENIATDIGTGTSSVKAAFQGNFEPLQGTTQPNIRDLFSEETKIIPESDTLASTTTTDGFQKANLYQKTTPTLMDDAGNYYASQADFAAGKPLPPELRSPSGDVFTTNPNIPPKINTSGSSTNMYDTLKGYGSKAGDYMFRGGETEASILQAQDLAQQKYLASAKELGIVPTQAGIDAARKAAGPSFLAKVGPSLALATAAGAAGGFFDAPEEEEGDPVRTGLDVYKENPDKYDVRDLAVSGSTGDTTSPTSYGFEYNPYLFSKTPFQTVAEGGEIFPRRVGGIMPNEGIPNKDSVRAMLMPGEFVMTTDAVKGLGGGDMNKGINNMYSVMRNLEQRGKAMA